MSATTVERIEAWRPVLELDRGLKQEVTEEVFRRVRRLRARGERPPVMDYRKAAMFRRGVGYRPGEPIASLVVYALAVEWLERMPARERIISIGYYLDGLTSPQVRGELRDAGFRVPSRVFWRMLYGPERDRVYDEPAVIDWWTVFARMHPSTVSEELAENLSLTLGTVTT